MDIDIERKLTFIVSSHNVQRNCFSFSLDNDVIKQKAQRGYADKVKNPEQPIKHMRVWVQVNQLIFFLKKKQMQQQCP